jgi:hypothetical protein
MTAEDAMTFAAYANGADREYFLRRALKGKPRRVFSPEGLRCLAVVNCWQGSVRHQFVPISEAPHRFRLVARPYAHLRQKSGLQLRVGKTWDLGGMIAAGSAAERTRERGHIGDCNHRDVASIEV